MCILFLLKYAVIGLFVLFVTASCVYLMLHGESLVAPTANASMNPQMISGLMNYFQGMGIAFLVTGFLWVSIDREEQLQTAFTQPK